jgi:hypothetical protein
MGLTRKKVTNRPSVLCAALDLVGAYICHHFCLELLRVFIYDGPITRLIALIIVTIFAFSVYKYRHRQ